MAGFYSGIAVMILLAIAILLRDLFRVKKPHKRDDKKTASAIYQEQLEELGRNKGSGVISDEQYVSAVRELERLTLNESKIQFDKIQPTDTAGSRDWLTAGILFILVPSIALPLYYHIGQPDLVETLEAFEAQQSHNGNSGKAPTIEAMVEILAQRMEDNPNDIKGLTLLGRTYKSMGRFSEAIPVFERLYVLKSDEPQILLDYADTLAMANNNSMAGKAEELVHEALALDPENITGLWLAGMAAGERGEFETAIGYWQAVLPRLSDEVDIVKINELIGEAGAMAGLPTMEPQGETAEQVSGKSINVTVTLATELNESADASDTLFVFARAVEGPPMPLAVARVQVKDLPYEVTLDDSMAMMPALKLSNFDNVQVLARISKSGQPTQSPGDLVSEASLAIPGQKASINLSINTVVP